MRKAVQADERHHVGVGRLCSGAHNVHVRLRPCAHVPGLKGRGPAWRRKAMPLLPRTPPGQAAGKEALLGLAQALDAVAREDHGVAAFRV